MKTRKILFILLSLFLVSGVASAKWKMNPHTSKPDYYQDGVESAPSDGSIYGVKDGSWAIVLSGALLLDQDPAQTFTAGDLTETGLLRVDDGVLGLDSLIYTAPFTLNYITEKEGNIFLRGGVSGGSASGVVFVGKYLNVVDSLVDDDYEQAFIIGELDYTPGGAGDFVGQTGDKVNVIIDGTLYEDIDISAVTGLAGLYIPINVATGAYNSFTSSAQLRIESLTNTINSYVEIQEGTHTAQPVLARMGYGTGVAKSCRYGVGKKSIDVNHRQLVNPAGGAPFDWSSTSLLTMTPDPTLPEFYATLGSGNHYDTRLVIYNNDSENSSYHNIAIGGNVDVGFPTITSYQNDSVPVIGIAPNVSDYYVGTCLAIEDLGIDEYGNILGMRIYGYDNSDQVKAPLEVILQSPDGTNYILKVDDSGNLYAGSLD